MQQTGFHATGALAPRLATAERRTAEGIVSDPNPDRMQSRVYFMGAGALSRRLTIT